MEWIAEGSRCPWGRITGAVYLLYFLTAIFGEVISRRHVIYGDAVNLVLDALYVAVTVLLYLMFKPVNRNLSLIAAVFSLAGCVLTILDVLHRAPSNISPLLFFWAVLSSARVSHFQVDVPAAISGRADGACRRGLADLSVAARKVSFHLP
jgi:hypothetical protein